MFRKRDEDVVPPTTSDNRRVVQPILPRTPFSNNLRVTTGEPLHKLDVVMWNLRGFENLPHRFGRGRRHEFALLQHQEIAQQLPHGRRVGIVSKWISIALFTLAIMFADPDSAAVIG